MVSLFKRKDFFNRDEKERIISAIRDAEKQTSGEIRIFVERRCRFVDPLDRAAELFSRLKMDQTKERNGVLVYVALKDRQLAILGDRGIHEKVGSEFWNNEVRKMLMHFSNNAYSDGIIAIVYDIGTALTSYFPYDSKSDKNELPDDIVFGK